MEIASDVDTRTDIGADTIADTIDTTDPRSVSDRDDKNEDLDKKDVAENENLTNNGSIQEEEDDQRGKDTLAPTKPLYSKPSHPSPRTSEVYPREVEVSSSSSSSSSLSSPSRDTKDPHDVCPEATTLLNSGITMPPAEIFHKLFQLQSIDMDPRYISSMV